MDAIRAQLSKPLVAGLIGLVVGMILGLVVLGWWLFPVQWTDAGVEDLAYPAKVEFLRASIEAYSQNGDATKARSRYQALGDDGQQALQDVASAPLGLTLDQITAFSGVVAVPGGEVALTPAAVTPDVGVGPAVTAPAGQGEAGGRARSLLSTLLPVVCLLVLLLVAALIVSYVMRGRAGGTVRASTPAMQAQQAARQAPWTDYQASGVEPPMAQFMASYKLGDDLFDDSFSIDSPGGEFLGECGVGISETIGVGDPKKVTAFEVWLFDKNDIQTVTKVWMSRHAFDEENIRQRLAAKGEPVQAEPGAEVVLETQTLTLVARVVDMGYGEGSLPSESFFDRFILELAVWSKA